MCRSFETLGALWPLKPTHSGAESQRYSKLKYVQHVKHQQLVNLSAVYLTSAVGLQQSIRDDGGSSVGSIPVFVLFFCGCGWAGGRVSHSHPESPESCQSVLQSLLLTGGHMCYMSPPLLLLLLTHKGYVQLNVHYKNCYFHTYNGSNHCVVLDESLTFMKLLRIITQLCTKRYKDFQSIVLISWPTTHHSYQPFFSPSVQSLKKGNKLVNMVNV